MEMRVFLFFFVLLCVRAEQGCPPSEDIAPCTCQDYVYVDLKCENITDADKLIRVFERAERYHFNKFTLKDSSLQYIPHVIFNDVEVKVMDFETVSFINTFDEVPKNPGLQRIYVSKVKIAGGWDWSKLSIFTQLQDLTIEDVPIKRLSTDFRPNISKGLKILRLSWCNTKKFRDDEFTEFTQLEKFTASHDELSTVKRSMFATPSKLRELSFEYNHISSISEDMFSEMPHLILVSFGNNRLSLLPEKIFKPIVGHIQYLRLQDNPFKCDCRMEWIVSYSSDIKYFYGRCESPKSLSRKNLADLTAGDFRC